MLTALKLAKKFVKGWFPFFCHVSLAYLSINKPELFTWPVCILALAYAVMWSVCWSGNKWSRNKIIVGLCRFPGGGCGLGISSSNGRGPNGWSIRLRPVLRWYKDRSTSFIIWKQLTLPSGQKSPLKPNPLPLFPRHSAVPSPLFFGRFPS